MNRQIVWIFFIFFIISNGLVVYCSGEFDATAVVSSVTDGDTFETTSEGTIRLADVDAPEIYEVGYRESKDYLFSLISGKTVYLDIDDLYRTGGFGRLICVVYVSYNSSHYLNVNKALIEGNYANAINFDNEFNSYSWELYVNKNDIPEFPSWTLLLIMGIAVIILVVIYRRNLYKQNLGIADV